MVRNGGNAVPLYFKIFLSLSFQRLATVITLFTGQILGNGHKLGHVWVNIMRGIHDCQQVKHVHIVKHQQALTFQRYTGIKEEKM